MPARLTQSTREIIVARVLSHSIQPEQKKLDADMAAFGDAVYKDIYSESDRRKMARLPKGWLPQVEDFTVQFGSDVVEVGFSPRPAKHQDTVYHYRRVTKQYLASHALSEQHSALMRRRDSLKDRRAEIASKVMATLKSVSTVKRLYEIWPESKKFTEGLSFEVANLPAVPIKQLNKLIGIA